MMQYVAFQDSFLSEAAEILALRHHCERNSRNELPERFENPAFAFKALSAVWQKPSNVGIAALDGKGQLQGYMIGTCMADTYRGRYIWIDYAGSGIRDMQGQELYRDLYAQIGETWVSSGYFNHFVLVPALDSHVLDQWLQLGFSYQQTYALLDLERIEPEMRTFIPDLTIRRVTKQDQEALREAAEWNSLHQARTPAWSPIMPEILAEIRDGYAGIVDDSEALAWVAIKDKQIVGLHAYWPATASDTDMIVPEGCIELSAATTNPSSRGKGIGRMLTSHCLGELRRRGYRYCMADWHVPNLLASRFWPKRGFRPVMYRLVRKVDERISWADGGVR